MAITAATSAPAALAISAQSQEEGSQSGEKKAREKRNVVREEQIAARPVKRQCDHRLADEVSEKATSSSLGKEDVGVPQSPESGRLDEGVGQRAAHPPDSPRDENGVAVVARQGGRQVEEAARSPAR